MELEEIGFWMSAIADYNRASEDAMSSERDSGKR
jgi:hypothetical protein